MGLDKATFLLKSIILDTNFSKIFRPVRLSHTRNFSAKFLDVKTPRWAQGNRPYWSHLRQLSPRFSRLRLEKFSSLPFHSNMSVTLKDGSRLLVDEAIAYQKVTVIAIFNSPEAFTYFLETASLSCFSDLWQEESALASLQKREPSYLAQLLQAKELKISAFFARHMPKNLPRNELSKLAYSLLFSMHGFENNARETARDMARETAREAALRVVQASSLGWEPAWNAAEEAAWNAAENSSWNAAWAAAWQASWNAAWNAPRSSALHAANSASKEVAGAVMGNEPWELVSAAIRASGLSKPQAIGHFAYRVAEKLSLFYFLQHSEGILKAAFQAANEHLPEIPEGNNIFSSRGRWRRFKGQYFAGLSPEQRQILSPWLTALDQLAFAIEQTSS